MNKDQIKDLSLWFLVVAIISALTIGAIKGILYFTYSGVLTDLDSLLITNTKEAGPWITAYPMLVIASISLIGLSILVDTAVFNITHSTSKHPLEAAPYWIMGSIVTATAAFTMSFFAWRLTGLLPLLIAAVITFRWSSIKPTNDTEPEEVLPIIAGIAIYIIWRVFLLPFSILTGATIFGFALFLLVRIAKRNGEFSIAGSVTSMIITGISLIVIWTTTTSAKMPELVWVKSKSYIVEEYEKEYPVNVAGSIPDSVQHEGNGWKYVKSDVIAVTRVKFARNRDSVVLNVPSTLSAEDIEKLHQSYWDTWRANLNVSGGTIAYPAQQPQ